MERRIYPRIEANVVVDYTGTEILLYHQINNISEGGVSIAAPAVEELGTIVDLTLNFPEYNRSVDVEGEVVWANNTPPCDMGIRFRNLRDEDLQFLKEYLKDKEAS